MATMVERNKDMKTDSVNVLETTEYVVKHAKSVSLHEDKVDALVPKILEYMAKNQHDIVVNPGTRETFEQDAQQIFLQDAVNFCYWAEKDKPKWEIEFPKGTIIKGGAYAMAGSFRRAVAEHVPILNADYLAGLTQEQTVDLFRSSNGVDMPLLKERQASLSEAGQVLTSSFKGKFTNVIEESGYDAVKLVKLIYENFSSFRDIAKYNGKDIYFLKRAQICADDVSFLIGLPHKLANLGKLTAFADYKLPQMLREAGIIEYTPKFAEQVDNMVLIKAGSKEEVEIRAATVQGIELIRQRIPEYTAAAIDSTLWYISQDQTNVRPYHRTYTIYY
jgi:hypothetical protein